MFQDIVSLTNKKGPSSTKMFEAPREKERERESEREKKERERGGEGESSIQYIKAVERGNFFIFKFACVALLGSTINKLDLR